MQSSIIGTSLSPPFTSSLPSLTGTLAHAAVLRLEQLVPKIREAAEASHMSVQRLSKTSRCAYSSAARFSKLPTLPSSDLETFRTSAFEPARPVRLSRGHVAGLPATAKWFLKDSTDRNILNISYLLKHGDAVVPLEITRSVNNDTDFARVERPLSEFLDYMKHEQDAMAGMHSACAGASSPLRVYLAQCPLSTLPQELRDDLPTPSLVLQGGRGDIYDSSIWIGPAPTYTPLHRDPNPNLFVQLAGRKIVRILEPGVGREIFAESQRVLGRNASAAVRGEEMMQGEEKRLLEEMIWGDDAFISGKGQIGYEVEVEKGDAIFIPKGWWHSIKGVGQGVVGSVNWWFL